MAEIDRTVLIEKLDALSDEDDATALAAAREAGRLVSSAGLSWDDVLFPEAANDTFGDDGTGPKIDLSDLPDDVSGQIEMLLARSDLNDDTRDDLETFKQDIASGSLADEDRRYLEALLKRLSAS